MLEATVNPGRAHHLWVPDLVRRIEACRTFPAVVEATIARDPYDWLQSQTDDFKLIWGDRGKTTVIAGLGVAKQVSTGVGESATMTVNRCRATLTGLPEQRMYGGFAFRPDGVWQNSPWQPFGAATFWLPRATLQDGRLQMVIVEPEDVPAAIRFARRLTNDIQGAESVIPPWIRSRRPPGSHAVESMHRTRAGDVCQRGAGEDRPGSTGGVRL